MTAESGGFQGSAYLGFGNAGDLGFAGSSYRFDVAYEHGPFAALVAGQWLKKEANTSTDHSVLAGASCARHRQGDGVRRLLEFEMG